MDKTELDETMDSGQAALKLILIKFLKEFLKETHDWTRLGWTRLSWTRPVSKSVIFHDQT